MTTAISNPPYNLKWNPEPFAQLESRFNLYGVPPASNANFAFVLTAMENSEEGIFILPQGAFNTNHKDEKNIIKNLAENNLIKAVIACPDNMFEKTSIAVSILILSKKKKTSGTIFIDLSDKFEIVEREQAGQYGGAAHTSRTYKKKFKVISDTVMERAVKAISDGIEEETFSKIVSLEDLRKSDYNLTPKRYFEVNLKKSHRKVEDIVRDLNSIVFEKNKCKLTLNETLAKTLGFDKEVYKKKDTKELNDLLTKIGAEKLINDDYITFTKNAGEFKFENKSKTEVSSIIMMILNIWKQHIYYLNDRENVYLAELRDLMIEKLMSGEVEV